MKPLGLVMLSVGFLGAAIVTVHETDAANLKWSTIDWGWYAVFFTLGAAGVVLLRLSARGAATESGKLEGDIRTIDRSLASLVDKLQGLIARKDTTGVYEIHAWIDDQLVSDLGDFVEAREALIHVYGLQQYANLMNEFATSERNINRSWSASADGYIDEVWKCMRQAEIHMREARQLLVSYQSA